MIRRSTVVYLVLLLALIGTYIYFKNREQPATDVSATPEATAEETKYLFTAEDGLPTSIQIVAKDGSVVEVARDADNAWGLNLPIEAKADQASAEAAASQVSTMRILDSIAKDIDPEVLGVKVPEYILNIKFSSGVERTVKVGVVTPTESGYYVQDASSGDVVIVSKSSLDALLGLLTAPPYLETPTPSPIPTETVLPASATPTPGNETATPQP